MATDFNANGRLDRAYIGADGALTIDQDVTPNYGNWIEIALTGVKNIKSAMGAKVEVKAGTSYEKQTYAGVPMVFRLGARAKVDTVRIFWPNGLIQNEINQPVNRILAIKEKPRLAGSCPMIYIWDGDGFSFLTDVLGVAPLGASSGDGQFFATDHQEYVSVPGDALKQKDGAYEIRVTEELREVSFMDQIKLQAVDHPATVDIVSNEKFKSPPYPEFRLFGASHRIHPISARDQNGVDVLPKLLKRDFIYPDFRRNSTAVAEMHSLDLDFGKAAASNHAVLMLDGWLDWPDGSTFLAASQEHKDLIFPYLQVKDAAGNWKTVIEDMGMPSGRQKRMAVDLSWEVSQQFARGADRHQSLRLLGRNISSRRRRRAAGETHAASDPIRRLAFPGILSRVDPGKPHGRGELRLQFGEPDHHVESHAGQLYTLWRREAAAGCSRRPHGDHGLWRRNPASLQCSGATEAAGWMEARFPVVGGWLGQGRRREHGVFANGFAHAVSRDEQLSVPGEPELPA